MAKWRIGKASRSAKGDRTFRRALTRPTEPTTFVRRHSTRDASEAGFTLIELVVTTAILPIIIGAIAVGILSIFSLQSSVANRLTDSGDAQLVSANFQNDVQSAVQITTASSPTNPAPCLPSGSPQQQVLELELGNGTTITYGVAPASDGKSYNLWRNKCTPGSSQPTTTLLAHDLPSSVAITPPITVTCSSSSVACVGAPTSPAYTAGWVSTLGVTGVKFGVTAPGSNYTYSVTATPVATGNSSQLATPSTPSTGCGAAAATTGTYAPPNRPTLCFVDFGPWNSLTAAQNVSCPNPISPTNLGGSLPMSAKVTNTPFILTFCMSVSGSWNSFSGQSGAISGHSTAAAPCGSGVSQLSGYNDIGAVPLPTYVCPPGSEAFLGNNGFYTGVPGDPGLYTIQSGSTAVVKFTNIQLVSSSGGVASNWQLVTGDAESTDQSESITWQSDQKLSLIPNSSNSPVGNACNSTPPSYNASSLTGVGTTTVECFNSPSEDHTGTVMLQAQTPSSLTITLVGTGLQAAFLGVLI